MKQLIFCLAFLGLTYQAQAIVEVRAGYGFGAFDDDDYQNLEQEDLSGFNVDAIVSPPLIFSGFGFGLRYETMTFDLGASEDDYNRIAAIVNYRIIDTFLHVGVIATYALDEEVDRNGTTLDADGASYSLGAEASVSLGLIRVGAEIGQHFAEFENPGNPNLDLSHIYAKVLVGVGF